eukprot:jgi/Ulvmu1/1458/UM011_0188.1
MASEYTTRYWSSVQGTDDAKRRADELLDRLAKRALIYKNTSGYEWNVDEDAELTELLHSMACPPVDHIRTQRRLSTLEPAAFLVWNRTMVHVLAQLQSERMHHVREFLLAQRLDTVVRALLTPESLWPEAAQSAGLQHIVLSWPTARHLLDAAFAACDPREFLLFLPRLGEIVLQAASFVHTCTVLAGISYLPERSDDPAAAEPPEPDGGVGVPGRVSVAEVTQGKKVFDEVVEHLAGLAVRAFAGLRRKNAAHAGDVLSFAGKIAMVYNFQREPPQDHPATALLRHFQPLQPLPPGAFVPALLQAVCSTVWLWLQAPREALEGSAVSPALGEVRACAACCVLRTSPQRCSRCRQEYYCCRACQKQRWPEHKSMCTPVDTSADIPLAAHPNAFGWPEVPPDVRQKILAATLQALEPFGHTPLLWEHLAQATPSGLRDMTCTLRTLGLNSYTHVDWAGLVLADYDDADRSSGEDSGVGSEDDESAGRRGMQERSVAAGAAVGLMVHMHWCHRSPADSGDYATVPSDWLASPYAMVRAACAACMPLLHAAEELQSVSGMRNAFRLLQNAARLALPPRGGHRWAVGEAAEEPAAQHAQQAMSGDILPCAQVALAAMTMSVVEAVRVEARNALQELARVMPPNDCAAMMERFITGLDAPGVQSQLLYVVLKRMQAAGEAAGQQGHPEPAPSGSGAAIAGDTRTKPQLRLWDSQQMGDVVLGPLFRIVKLTKSKKHGILETNDTMAASKAQHLVQQSEVLVAVINILLFQALRGRCGRLADGFEKCVRVWLAQHALPTDSGAGGLVRCLCERVDAARVALDAAGKHEEALAMELISCAAGRLAEVLSPRQS